MSERTTFLDEIRSGWADPEEIGDWINDWHRGKGWGSLREYLGFTPEQAARWVEDSTYIDVIVAEARARTVNR